MTVKESRAHEITLYRIREAAKLIGCSPDYLYDLMNAGQLTYVQMGQSRSMRRLRHRDVLRMINQRTIGR